MQTQTHTLLALALLSQPKSRKRNLAIFVGSLIPDVFIYLMWVWLTFVAGETQAAIWQDIYFQPPAQFAGAVSNSIPLAVLIFALGWAFRQKLWGQIILLGALAALIHHVTDLPVHSDDAHRHFWPISDWRFYSPLSYWDVDYHAKWVGIAECVLGLGLIFVLWRRFMAPWIRVILFFIGLFYIAMFALAFTSLG